MPQEKSESRKQTIQRINRIQGQLNSLKSAIENDRDSEYLVTQAHTIEKSLSSLIIHMVEDYIEHQAKILLHEDPEETQRSIKRLFELSHR